MNGKNAHLRCSEAHAAALLASSSAIRGEVEVRSSSRELSASTQVRPRPAHALVVKWAPKPRAIWAQEPEATEHSTGEIEISPRTQQVAWIHQIQPDSRDFAEYASSDSSASESVFGVKRGYSAAPTMSHYSVAIQGGILPSGVIQCQGSATRDWTSSPQGASSLIEGLSSSSMS